MAEENVIYAGSFAIHTRDMLTATKAVTRLTEKAGEGKLSGKTHGWITIQGQRVKWEFIARHRQRHGN